MRSERFHFSRPFILLSLMLLAGLLLVGCDQATEVTSVPQEEALLELASASQIQAVMAIQDRHTDRLLAISGAVGTATGLTEDGKPAIVVFITTNTLAKSARIPASIEEVPVIVEVTGMFVALTDTDPKARQPRPVPIGVSTGHPDITAGTIGARVKDSDGNVFALSNNHVYANLNEANFGDSALQPGSFDGGEDPADKIGELSDFEPILFDGSDNIIDAAIAISSTDLLGNSTPHEGYGTPNSATVSAALEQAVQKYGRTTGLTTGEVVGVNATVNVCYKSRGPFMCNSNFIAKFVKQIVISSSSGDFSSGGDSGSLIVTNDGSNNPVGLLFAGSSTRTIANPIDSVLFRFGVTIDDSEPVAPGAADATTSTITASPTSITADGTSESTVTVQLKDADGNSLTSGGDVVALSTDLGTIGAVTDNGDGTYSATLTAGTTAGTATVTGTLNGVPITDTATVTFTEPAAGVNVTSIAPNTMQSGTMIVVITISGSGFAAGAEVTFENGSGPAPSTSNVVVVDANTITGTVTAKSGGPGRNRVWD
ncbi:MAG: hypothetical protein IID12_01345, partial [Candidatus Marinimicrobia bacterium]|nr:hypothetical protein [Candidatus Neomarinimicrobiota bacterium]